MPKEKILSVEEAMNAAKEEINKLPKNKIREYLSVIEELKENGKKWKEIAEFFTEVIGIPAKAFNIKNIYFDAHPEKQKLKQASMLDDMGKEKNKE